MAEYLTVKDVALLIRVSESTVIRWIRRGYITPLRIGHTLRFERTRLLLQVEKHQSSTQSFVLHDPSLG